MFRCKPQFLSPWTTATNTWLDLSWILVSSMKLRDAVMSWQGLKLLVEIIHSEDHGYFVMNIRSPNGEREWGNNYDTYYMLQRPADPSFCSRFAGLTLAVLSCFCFLSFRNFIYFQCYCSFHLNFLYTVYNSSSCLPIPVISQIPLCWAKLVQVHKACLQCCTMHLAAWKISS